MSLSQKSEANRVKLYGIALSYLGTDASPADQAPDEYGCADTVSCIVIRAFGPVIKHTVATADLYRQLLNSKEFKKVKDFKFGDIILSPTVIGKQPGNLTNGHVGIVGEGEEVMSNTSANGLFTQNYTIQTWIDRYRTLGKYPIYFFRKI